MIPSVPLRTCERARRSSSIAAISVRLSPDRTVCDVSSLSTTVHAYTASQSVVDGPNKRPRRGRAAGANLVPSTTGAALATTRALPEYANRFDGIAIRASLPAGSIADLTFVSTRATTVEGVNQVLSDEAATQRYAGVLGVSRDPLVSSDVIDDPRASVVDLDLTKVLDGDLVKIMSWYDNELGLREPDASRSHCHPGWDGSPVRKGAVGAEEPRSSA
jgi:glyceraldehyde-3-phosphate dehydrogenase type I